MDTKECAPDMTTATVVVKRPVYIVASCLCTCGNDYHGFNKTIWPDELFAMHDEE